MPTQIYLMFKDKIDREAFYNTISKLKENSLSVLEELKNQIDNDYNNNLPDKRIKSSIIKFLKEYITEILLSYPDLNIIKKIHYIGKRLNKNGISDIFILNIFNKLKHILIQKDILNEIVEQRIDTDMLAILRPYTISSIEIEKKINNATTINGISDISIGIIDRINKAKKEHIQIKNRVIKAILDEEKEINIKNANECEFAKILSDIKVDIFSSGKEYIYIHKIHQNFHEYISFYLTHKDKLTSSQKYLLIKELESLSLKILFLLNELQVEVSSQLSFFDSLTDSYNKNIFPFVFQREVKRAKRYDFPLSIVIIDIDNFKQINDRYGHLTGDEVLKELSKVIKKNIRQSDYFFRFGGEEFILLLPHTDSYGALKTAEKIRHKIEENIFTEKRLKFTISCGISKLKNFENPYVDLEEADKMLYVAKNTGKNKCVISEGEG